MSTATPAQTSTTEYTFSADDWIPEFIAGGIILVLCAGLFYARLRIMALLGIIYAALIMWIWIGFKLSRMGGIRWPPNFQECPDYMQKTAVTQTGYVCTHRFIRENDGSFKRVTFDNSSSVAKKCELATETHGLTWDGCKSMQFAPKLT